MSIPGPGGSRRTRGTLPVALQFELFVDDVEVAVRFYEAALGLTPPPRWSPEGYVPVHAGAVTIGIQHCGNLSADHHFSPARLSDPRGVGVEIVIEVDDIDATYAVASVEATHHGGRVEPLNRRPWGATDFRLIDPDGYYVRVTSRLR